MGDSEITVPVSGSFPIRSSGRTRAAGIPDRDVCAPLIAPATLLQRCLSFPAMLGAVLVAAAATSARAFVLDPDVWWHIKQGGSILASHHVPRTDTYSLLLSGRQRTAY